jgi:putative membrane protein
MKSLIVGALLMIPGAAFAADAADATFYMQAAQGGMAEVELGKLAASKGSSENVRSFGKQMVTDHTKANEKLKTIAMQKKVTLPAQPDPEARAVQQKLQGLTGAAFDKAYIDSQVKDHDKTLALLENEIASGKDSDAKAWATETLPVVKQHAAMVKKMAGGEHGSH